MNNTLRFKTR